MALRIHVLEESLTVSASIECSAEWTVDQVKEAIRDLEGISPYHQQLWLHGRALVGGTLGDHGVADGDRLRLVLQCTAA